MLRLRRYNLINNLLGWVCFVIAAATYLLTLEPTASFWDCPEFIAQGFKLEVGHPPGNPIFMLTARFFINFTGGDVTKVALAVNAMNALLSAGTILLLFWTVTHLMRRLLVKELTADVEIPLGKAITIYGSGLVGALAYAWSDTFWFSAVEGEVYAFSSFCTALVFWLILKWENRAMQPHSDRFLILIAYVIGVSIGVHLLNLLCIPAIVLVFYYRKTQNPTGKGSLAALVVSFIIVALILFGLVPGFITVAQFFELLCVNDLHMGYNWGVLLYAIVALCVFAWAVRELYAQKSALRIKISFLAAILFSGMLCVGHSWWIGAIMGGAIAGWLWSVKKLPVRVLNVIALSILVIFIGYSSYALLLIRSAAHTPMNQNAPDNVFALASYLNREQYGETPLFYGTTFTSDVLRTPDGAAAYSEIPTSWNKAVDGEGDRYVKTEGVPKYSYIPELNMLFPRMYSAVSSHPSGYKLWGGFTDADMPTVAVSTYVDRDGKPMPSSQRMRKPTFGQNLSYFINYQLVHMYFRYFMWNFAGRQNDMLNQYGEVNKGNWISGIPFMDNARLGDQSLLPSEFGKGNKGHNVFYMLPLLLGVAGLLWQSMKGQRGIEQFWIVFFLFFMTGIAIVLYLNQPPFQPRERDYAFAGSFYAFAIWIGLGVGALAQGIDKLLKREHSLAAAVAASVIGLIVPIQMVSQTWDDHDRSGRYTTRDFGKNYLSSLDENAIIFTNGDNDTFPLWYAQEVEGYRTDVRVVNLSYLTTDWYAEQQLLPSYDAKPVPMSATVKDFGLSRRAGGYLVSREGEIVPAGSFLREYYSSRPDEAGRLYGLNYPVIEGESVYVPVDIEAAMKAGRVTEKDSADVVDAIQIDLVETLNTYRGSTRLTLADALMLDILNTSATNGWDRPVYIANTVPDELYLGLRPYMYSTGMAREVVPVYNSPTTTAATDKAYRNITERFEWGGIDAEGGEDVYLDETVQRMVLSTRNAILDAAEAMYNDRQPEKALELLRLSEEKLPTTIMPYGIQTGDKMALLFSILGEELGDAEALERSEQILKDEIMHYAPYLPYIQSLTQAQASTLSKLDRAVVLINDNQGSYSYLYILVDDLIDTIGIDEATNFLLEVRDQTGADLISFYNSLNQ